MVKRETINKKTSDITRQEKQQIEVEEEEGIGNFGNFPSVFFASLPFFSLLLFSSLLFLSFLFSPLPFPSSEKTKQEAD